MNQLTAKEILEIIESKMTVEEFGYFDFNPEELELGEITEVEQYGGEGDGSTWYSVKYFKDHDVYIRTDGYYSSYHGTDFNEGYGRQVVPKTIEKIVYESL